MSGRPAAALIGRAVDVEAPGTIANLGAGYDCLGLAVELPLRVAVEVTPPGSDPAAIVLAVDGSSPGALPEDRSNRFVVALEGALAALGFEAFDGVGWSIRMSNPIPLARGLGSSAAATVAGVVAGSALAGEDTEPGAALRLATAIEGHPDNVAPALLGGLVASLALPDRVDAVRLDPPTDVRVIAWIPDRALPTSEMRRVLPETVPRADAVANLARVAVGVAGLAAGRSDVLGLLAEDRLHEPYRAEVYPELPHLVAAARDAGAMGAFLSGAGSTVAALVDATDAAAADRVAAAFRTIATALGQTGRIEALDLRHAGTRVVSR